VRVEAVSDGPLIAATRRIGEELDPAALLLFGSRATGQAGPQSDYDLAVLVAGPPPSWNAVQSLRSDLEELLSATVDLVVLDEASPILAMQVLREGRLIACRDAQELENFTVRTLTDYADLKIIRREAEKRLMEPRRS